MPKNIEQITSELKAPFDIDKIEFKVGATNKEKTMGLALAYVEARAIQNRLDDVVGFTNWRVAYKEVQGGFLCSMSLRINGEWIEKEDGAQVTDYESVKGGISSAFKRVASSGWGVGRYLYDIDSQWHPIRKVGKGYDFTINPTIETKNRQNSSKENEVSERKVNEKIIKARSFNITFGKYKDQTLGYVYDRDMKYFEYLTSKAQNKDLINACKYLKNKKEIRYDL